MFLVYELGRVAGATEIRGFSRCLLGPFAPLYEILIGIGLLLSLAICAAAGGAIASSYLGVSVFAGGAGILLLITGLTFFGREIVERSMALSVAALGLLLVYLLIVALSQHGTTIQQSFASAELSGSGYLSAAKYALTVCGFLPLLLYSVRDVKSRGGIVATSLIAAIVAVVPAVAFHLAFMARYPEIVNQALPTYWLFEQITPSSFLFAYVVVVFILIAQTGVALLQGVIDSIDELAISRIGQPLSRRAHALISGFSVILATGFASIGIVALIIRVFDFLSVTFFIVFFVPLFTRGAYLVWRNSSKFQ